MNELSVSQRYDQFQAEAVANVVGDYREKLAGRYLLVIPTGGGKTITAVKSVNELFRQAILDPESDRVVWAAHRQELVNQAETAIADFDQRNPGDSFGDRIEIMMISRVTPHLRTNNSVRLVVIDEAHHAATTNIQYGPIFDYPSLGILGLTATPSRHDGQPLKFEKETYSIGFPDLVDKRIILSPEIREIRGDRFEGVTRRGNRFSGLDDLLSDDRDDRIIQHILEHHKDYTKIIVYASTVRHTIQLYERMSRSPLAEVYEAIEYVTGSDRSGPGEREEFIKRIKGYERAIVVNHDVLSEGYDDPKTNTVIMARPSRSKLVYMQAIGRAIRVDPNNRFKTAYIVEVADDLPNIRYRIDNRWLFSDISDTLEPAVEDEFFGSAGEFRANLQEVYRRYEVLEEQRLVPEWDKSIRYSLLLFRSYVGAGRYRHIPILIDNSNRTCVSNWFNFLSERMESYRSGEINPEQAMLNATYQGIASLDSEIQRRLVYDSMEEASKVACSDVVPDADEPPWITFVALRYRQSAITDAIRDFIAAMVNREHIEHEVMERAFESGAFLVRYPLPLSSYIGQIIPGSEFWKIKAIVDRLRELRDLHREEDHRIAVRDLLDQSILPVDMIYRSSLP